MKKILLTLMCIALFFGITKTAGAEYSTANTSDVHYYVPDYEPKLEYEQDGYYVKFEWSEAKEEQFKYYKLVYSGENKKPVYPENQTVFVGSKVSQNGTKTKYRKGYWRVCHVYRGYYEEWEKTKYRVCSNVVYLGERETDEDDDKYEDKEKYYDKDTYQKKEHTTTQYKKATSAKNTTLYNGRTNEKKTGISSNLKKRADTIVLTFKKRLDHSKLSNEVKAKKINTIVSKLNAIKKSKPKLAAIVEYLVLKLEDLREDYSDNFDDIEKLFDF